MGIPTLSCLDSFVKLTPGTSAIRYGVNKSRHNKAQDKVYLIIENCHEDGSVSK